MKKTLLALTLLLTITSFGQKGRYNKKTKKETVSKPERVKKEGMFFYDNQGLTPKFLVKEIDSLNNKQLYSKTIDWIKDTYKNPDEVIKAKFENEKVRFIGFKSSHLKISSLGIPNYYNVRYTVEIYLKNGKYKFQPVILEYYTPPSQYSRGGWNILSFDNAKGFYNKKGKLKNLFKYFPEGIDSLFNDLENSLNTYLLKKAHIIKDKNNDW